uniref:START domain-containing protein n=1 Tax=viral metagenome TaxID=1070528 RepID=A0A6C0JUS7_9ZZZZ
MQKQIYTTELFKYRLLTHTMEQELSNRNGVSLMYKKNNDQIDFKLKLEIINNQFYLDTLIDFNIFKLIESLNTDIIECIHMEQTDDLDTMNICMVLKPIGKEVGLSQKYILSRTTKIQSNHNVQFISNDLKELGTIKLNVEAEPVRKNSAILNIDIMSRFHLNVTYSFNLELESELPIYMEKLPGQLIQKMFIRLKTWLETIQS